MVPNRAFRTPVRYCRMGVGFMVVFGSVGPLPLSESKGPSAMLDYDAMERRGMDSRCGGIKERRVRWLNDR